MVEIVRDPGCQELAQCHNAELRMTPAAIEIRRAHVERSQLPEIRLSERREVVEKIGQRPSGRRPKLGEPIESLERARLTVLQNDFRTWNPIGPLAVNEMSDDIERTPCVDAFTGGDPLVRQTTEERIERRRRSRQDRDRLLDRKCALWTI